MTSDEAKAAFMSGVPVVCGEIEYKCISALIYRNVNGRVEMTLELRDKRANSVTVADKIRVFPAKIQEAQE